MKIRKYAVFMLLLFVFFGCTEYKYIHEINKDGNSVLTIKVEYSKYLEMAAESEGKTYSEKVLEFREEKEEQCEKIKNENLNCEIEGTEVILKMNMVPGEYYEFEKEEKIPDYIYILKINKIPNPILEDNFILGKEDIELKYNYTDDELASLKAAKEVGFVAEYIITMPGVIEKSNWGEYKEYENSIVFDLFEIGENPGPIIVVSKERNDFYFYIVMIVGVVLFFTIIYNLFLKNWKKEKRKRPLSK
ncbi:MAG: hypothetical protein PHU63_00605 [Candidatus ainarchaeum sp.]|nr:hypothetical protein [Candidatus ainarchaeum sp.]